MPRAGSSRQLQFPTDGLDEAATEALEKRMAFILRMRARGIADLAVLRALETVPRERFVPHRYVDLAWHDVSLPIGCGQTMPEPRIVARMMEALAPNRKSRVLEIGTGSGYATAVLARLSAEVVTLERFRSLTIEAAGRLMRLGIRNTRVHHADGLAPVPETGLFDRILIHAVQDPVPDFLLGLLSVGGRIVTVSPRRAGLAMLVQTVHSEEAGFLTTDVCACRAGPLIPGVSSIL